jgi:hypothetical protein
LAATIEDDSRRELTSSKSQAAAVTDRAPSLPAHEQPFLPVRPFETVFLSMTSFIR